MESLKQFCAAAALGFMADPSAPPRTHCAILGVGRRLLEREVFYAEREVLGAIL